MLEGVVGQVEVLVTGFEAALASVGDLVLVGGEVAAGVGDTGIFTLIAVDPNARSVVWIRALGLSQNDNPLVAVEGYRSPSGEQALITLVEHDPASDARSDVWSYYLIDEYGEGVVGPPGIDRFFPTSGVTGWYDEGSLLYVADLSVPQIVTWELDTGDHSPIRPRERRRRPGPGDGYPGRRRTARGAGPRERSFLDRRCPCRSPPAPSPGDAATNRSGGSSPGSDPAGPDPASLADVSACSTARPELIEMPR